MSVHRAAALAVVFVCLSGFALAQDDEPPLNNWSAPPFWNPTPPPRVEGEPGAMLVHGQAMQAQAEALPSSPLPFVAIQPCRIVDTREALDDGFHRPNFADGESRTFPFPSSPACTGLPATAGAWSVNIQFRPISQLSYLTAYPTGTTMPLVSTMTAGPAAWVQNAAIVPAGTGGAIDIYCQYAGRVVIDINGYYGPQSVVTSLNALVGDVTLAEGSNVGIYPAGSTITISATGGPGGDLPAGAESQTLRHNGKSWVASSALANDGTNVAITGNLLLPDTTATSGQVQLGGSPFLHNYRRIGTNGHNTFVGELAGNVTMGGVSASDGSYNTGVGFETLYSNTIGRSNTAVGHMSLRLNTEGLSNTAVGEASLENNTTGDANTSVGAYSLLANTSGYANTSVGDYSLPANTIGRANCAFGAEALRNNRTAGGNTALGYQALYSQSFDNGDLSWYTYNTAVGYRALYSNQPDGPTNGMLNTAVGYYALNANTTGDLNTAVGTQSLDANTTGTRNTAIGNVSLSDNTTGGYNTAIGHESLTNNTTGSNNVAVGYWAGRNVSAGSDNIHIGSQGAGTDDHVMRLGSGQTKTYIAGITDTDVGASATEVFINASGQLGTLTSSIRFKQDVADMGDASARLMRLRPVSFRYAAHPDGSPRYGLIAEEVEQVMPELVVRDADGRPNTVAYHQIPALLLNELLRQEATIQRQQAQIEELQRLVEGLLAANHASQPRGSEGN